uniref:Latrophilin Cirl-like n=1 Tax=Dermatophagoides pteronyssinus TaxID=6956 RepID=A0A6P6XUK2_DERPT|nr:latrophilin Cirl-like [Dermatophagoides pteronyssinus]
MDIFPDPSSSVSLSSNVTTLKHPPIIFEQSNNQLQQNSDSSSIRQSAYVCEDDQLELSCLNDKHLDILRANFGRFSITVCNPSGFLDWSVNCASGNSILPILTERCANQKHCSIRASSLIFGDPCPGTAKYLEVHYRCVSGKCFFFLFFRLPFKFPT